MKLIAEEITQVDFLTEATEDGKKNYFIEGIFLQAELQNRNGRMYPKKVLEREVAKYQRYIDGASRQELEERVLKTFEHFLGKL